MAGKPALERAVRPGQIDDRNNSKALQKIPLSKILLAQAKASHTDKVSRNIPLAIYLRIGEIREQMEANDAELAAIEARRDLFERAWSGNGPEGLSRRIAILQEQLERGARELDLLCSAPSALLEAQSRGEIRAATRDWPGCAVAHLVMMSQRSKE